MEDKKKTICAVVVTYNRKNLLLECIESLLRQTHPLDAIYLIDNASIDGTPEVLKKSGYIKEILKDKSELFSSEYTTRILSEKNIDKTTKIYYVRMYRNTGGAGGFYEGIKRGYEKGYDLFWLMDDDAEPKKDALEKLVEYFGEKNVIALAPTVKNSENKISIYDRRQGRFSENTSLYQKPLSKLEYEKNKIEIDMASFVGILIKKEAISKIGFPKKDFFMRHDDTEYCIRLRHLGKILLITNSIIIHKEQIKKLKRKKYFLGKLFIRWPHDKLWHKYYEKRNIIWSNKKYTSNRKIFYALLFKNYIQYLLGVLLFDDNKFKRIKFITNAYFDGLKGIFDNDKPKLSLNRTKNGCNDFNRSTFDKGQ